MAQGLLLVAPVGGDRRADQAVVQMGWSLAFMDSTARQVLELMPTAPER